ncbi:MAG: type I toxin-antitoxin system Fst family toxin [Lactobacillus sp.]|nr:type I toxin-antitoxin system Fst family toxin [Lactobacillus sp.]MCH3906201.1 type I toxin-antitoxin system Fst family toxin [Lactobacillus sp.]MCH3990220.1 type I toxin-antitoxin system Fst family toxin [Lactobacillus sp.]MCH4069066.1 type I toxin-antitoxin system Fst family toxin [Lactobacillus sp.]MCI1303947.1 type I toxin-antitoxin system Fst family toxin [Lactobacillus sp.]
MHDLIHYVIAPIIVGIAVSLFEWWLGHYGNDK